MQKNVINKERKDKFLLKMIICLILLLIIFLLPKYSNKSYATESELQTGSEYYYLSDINYDTSQSSAGWGSILKDKASDNSLISVKIEGGYYSFQKGMWAHASSTIVYDLRGYDYDYFTAYIGLNRTAASSSNGVIYKIYTSADGRNWGDPIGGDIKKLPGENATFIKIDIREKKHLKLVADSNGSNGNDHSVYADAKLIKEGYEEPGEKLVPSITQLDTKIKEFVVSNADLSTNQEYELTLLKRELINRTGNYALKRFLGESEDNRLVYEWLTGDLDILRLYVMGGIPDGGSYYNSLTILAKLYKEYSSDFENTETLNNPTYPEMTYGDLYKKMALSIALTHTQRVGLWMQAATNGENDAEPLRRYAIFKYMHKNGKFRITDSMDMTHTFEDLYVEEMRLILSNSIDDEEILWLNQYVQDNVDRNPNNVWRYTTPHPYIAYVWPNYANPVYYADENVSYFNELFAVNKSNNNVGTELVVNGENTGKIGLFDSEFVIPGGKNIPEYRLKITRGTSTYQLYKVWMNFRNKFGTGAVCGGISKSGANIRGTHGIPAIVVGQPGHAALLFYSKDAQGRGYWRLDNDVSGWTATGKSARFLGWGNGSYASGYTGVYMEFEQAAVNDHDNLIKAEEQVMLAKVYNSDLADETKKQAALGKQEELYRKALEIQSINFDAWLGLIDVYKANENKTENDFYDLAEELAENLKYFPLPMYHATNLIKSKLTSIENTYRFTLLQTRILEKAKSTPDNTADSFTVCQPSVTRLEANFLLGQVDKTIATFSFDGADAGKIVLSSRFDGNGVRWDYCLTGKGENTDWRDAQWIEVSFTAEEEHKLQLTPEQIRSITAENDIYVHIVGVNYDEKNLYKIDITEQANLANLYANDLENRVVGVNLNTEWRYTENDAWTSYSVVSPDLTGNKTVQVRQAATGTKLTSPASEMYTFTEDNQPDTRKYIPVSHLSKVSVSTEAVNNGGAAVNALDANYNTRYHSAWNGTDTERFLVVKLDKPVHLSAVEFVPAGGGNGRIVKGEILGSLTGEDGTWVSLVNNNDAPWSWPAQANTVQAAKAQTKSFEIPEENRQDKVQFIKIIAHQTNGNWFAARAFNFFQDLTKADTHPTAGIAYSTTETTSEPVVARLVNPSTNITITNNDGNDSYVFTKNGEFEFEFEDEHGNKGSALAKVTWIDKQAPSVDVNYKLSDDKKLMAVLDNISEDVYLLDHNNKKTNFVEVKNGKIVSISFLDENEEIYKVSELDANKVTEKITYKNTTNKVDRVKYYEVTFRKDENGNVLSEVESRVGIDEDGNMITLTESEIEELRILETMRSNPLEFYLEKNEEYEFILLDKASNIAYKNIRVDYIENDTKILASDITYSTTMATKDPVTATIKPYLIDMTGKSYNVEIVNNNKKLAYTFTENDKFTFQYAEVTEDEEREIKAHTAVVDWIDKIVPTAEIRYSTQETTNKQVVATLVNESEPISIINNGASREYTFTQNGEFTFEFIDKAGNRGTKKAVVDWIDQTAPTAQITYSTTQNTSQPVIATLTGESEEITITNNGGNRTYTFTENGQFTFEFQDKAGNKATQVAIVDWITKEQEKPEETVKIGDIDGNGKLGPTDLAKLKLHLIGKQTLTGRALKAADINRDGRVTATDLARLKLALIGKIQLK